MPGTAASRAAANTGLSQSLLSLTDEIWGSSGFSDVQRPSSPAARDLPEEVGRDPRQWAELYSQQQSQKIDSNHAVSAVRLDKLSKQTVLGMGWREIVAASNQSLLGVVQDAEEASRDPHLSDKQFESKIAGMADGLQTTIDNLDQAGGEVWDEIAQLNQMASSAKDPASQAKLMRRFTQLMAVWETIQKERKKAEAIKTLLLQLLMGTVNPDTINKLRKMGLGNLAERLVKMMIPWMRRTGRMNPAVVAALQSVGMGHLVTEDAARQAAELDDRRRGLRELQQARTPTEVRQTNARIGAQLAPKAAS